jgi:hypothetical protein
MDAGPKQVSPALRVAMALLLGGVVAVYVLLYQLILADTVRRTGHHTEFWVTAACMAVLTVFGAVANAVPNRSTNGVVQVLALLSYVLAPGGWLVASGRQLPGRQPNRPDRRYRAAQER